MFLLEGSIKISADKLEASRQVFIDFVNDCNQEQGCLEFSFSIDIANPSILNIRERFIDAAAFEVHQKADHTIAFKKKLYDIGVQERDVRFYPDVDPIQR